MIILKKTKLKLKKQVWIIFIILLFLAIGIYAGKKIYADIKYKKTDEYKLIEIGYKKEDIKILEKQLDKKTYQSLFSNKKDEFILSLIKEKYYIKKNLSNYLAYQKEHVSDSPAKIISMVNTFNNYKYYDHDLDADLSKDTLVITNKFYHLKENYMPNDLVAVSNKYYYGSNHKIRKVAYDAFIDMWNAAHDENIYLIINSSFRPYSSQVSVYDAYKNTKGTTYADSVAARPGYSEHQTGLSIDVFSKENTTTANFKGSTAHVWLQNNAHRFGFIERYQEDKVEITGFAAEAWHWRYVGVEVATYIHDNNITFDEYYAYFIENQE